MINKEELEKLIEEKATVYFIERDMVTVTPITLNSHYITKDYCCEKILGKHPRVGIPICYMFKTREDAECSIEERDFVEIVREQFLILPDWNEIFPDKENHFYDGTYNCWWDDCCKYDIYINAFITNNDFENGYFDINGHREFGITRRSYINVRKIAKKIFLEGEEE